MIKDKITEETWCQHVYAKDKDGLPTLVDSQTAHYWCLVGWIIKEYPNEKARTTVIRKLRESALEIFPGRICDYLYDLNDTSTFAEIKQLVEKANV